MLDKDPVKRPTAVELLQEPFIQQKMEVGPLIIITITNLHVAEADYYTQPSVLNPCELKINVCAIYWLFNPLPP